MAVTDELDLTPPATFNTVQFQSEFLNVIVLSLLTSFTAANVGSLISKLVYFTRGSTFNFNSWNRAYIFANSDDPLRILSWLLRRYVYRDRKWPRAQQRVRYSRLVFPLLARCAVLFTTIATIGIAIPKERDVRGCVSGDYRMRWNASKMNITDDTDGICQNIPLTSRVGFVKAIASYCTETQRSTQRDVAEDIGAQGTTPPATSPPSATSTPSLGYTLINVNRSVNNASLSFSVENSTNQWSMTFRIELKDTLKPKVLFLADIANLDLDEYMNIASLALGRYRRSCRVLRTERTADTLSNRFSCGSDAFDLFILLKLYTKNALVWERQPNAQPRLKLQSGLDPVYTTECPFTVSVSLPVVNILPLTIMFLISLSINVCVSFAVSFHGNVMDAAFHIIKDTFGRDSTSNPLEENEETDEIVEVHLRKYLCPGSGGGHISFIGRNGDQAVQQLDGSVVVGGCAQASGELRRVTKAVQE